MTIRLIMRPHRGKHGPTGDRFDAFIGDDLICTSREPLFAGARELLARGYDPSTLMTTRHDGKDFDSFKPAPIGKLAKLMIMESSRDGLRLVKWKPMSEADKAQLGAPRMRVAAE